MFTFWQLRRSMFIWGVTVKVSLFCEAEHKEASVMVTINGRIAPKTWNDPKWHEVETPEKSNEWFRRIDLDSIAYNHRHMA
jgi:hypothetical protein